MCIDYRALSKHTIRDHFPILRIGTLLNNIGKNRVFTTLDLQSGYHQMLLHDSDIPKTAFVTHKGQFQFKVLCFGLTNAPSAFQSLMNSIFRDLIDARVVQIYLDDILVMSQDVEQPLAHLGMVFEKLQKAQLRVKMSKCEWARLEVKFLMYIIGHGKVRPDPAKIEVIKTGPYLAV
jgi:putative transposase